VTTDSSGADSPGIVSGSSVADETKLDLHDAPTPAPAPSDDHPVVVTHGLVRSFGSQRAVDDIDLTVPRGSVFGFLGPNGSGKTTTIRLLLGLIAADAGSIQLFGQPMPRAAASVLPRVGALVEGPAFYPYLTGDANLTRLQAIDKTNDPRTARTRRQEALERVGLSAAATKRFRHYSLGMKQRLGIAAALMRHRDLLILDEPTNGLDPQGTREIRQLVRQLHDEGTTIIVSSHLLSEIEQVCTHVGIMSRGRLIAQEPLTTLRAMRTPRLRVETTHDTVSTAREVLTGLGLAIESSADDASPDVLLVTPGDRPIPQIAQALVDGGVGLAGLSMERPALEEIFVELTGAGFDVAG